MMDQEDLIARVRRFTRFYSRRIGLLREKLNETRFSLAEGRVIYELAQCTETTASALARELGLDPGYLSRMLASFHEQGLLQRRQSETDGRQSLISLTEAGRAAFVPLDAHSHDEVAGMLAPLGASDRRRLAKAMAEIETLLGDRPPASEPYILRPHRPGDMGWIIQRHGALYAQEFGWDDRFEGTVAEIAAGFLRNFDPRRERCWIAERDGTPLGTVTLVRQSDEMAKLRLLLVEPEARGLGLGRRLVEECIRFARSAGYRGIMLWTNDVLLTARRLYVEAGFRLVAEEPHADFGPRMVGETWQLDFTP